MTGLPLIRLMAGNNAFANARLLSACAQLDEAAFAAKRVSFFPSLMLTLNHNLAVDRYYLATLEGTGGAYADCAIASPADLQAAQTAEDERLVKFCEGLTEETLAREVATDRGADGVVMERTDHTLLHLFQHQIHHRGQAHAMLAGTPVAPPQLDEFYLRYDRGPDAAHHGAPL